MTNHFLRGYHSLANNDSVVTKKHFTIIICIRSQEKSFIHSLLLTLIKCFNDMKSFCFLENSFRGMGWERQKSRSLSPLLKVNA